MNANVKVLAIHGNAVILEMSKDTALKLRLISGYHNEAASDAVVGNVATMVDNVINMAGGIADVAEWVRDDAKFAADLLRKAAAPTDFSSSDELKESIRLEMGYGPSGTGDEPKPSDDSEYGSCGRYRCPVHSLHSFAERAAKEAADAISSLNGVDFSGEAGRREELRAMKVASDKALDTAGENLRQARERNMERLAKAIASKRAIMGYDPSHSGDALAFGLFTSKGSDQAEPFHGFNMVKEAVDAVIAPEASRPEVVLVVGGPEKAKATEFICLGFEMRVDEVRKQQAVMTGWRVPTLEDIRLLASTSDGKELLELMGDVTWVNPHGSHLIVARVVAPPNLAPFAVETVRKRAQLILVRG